MDKIRLGVAGCGASVWMHGPALARQEHAEVVAWMDPSYDAAAKAAAEYGGEIYTDYAEMLQCDFLDAVIVASPPWLHVEQVELAAQAGKHVLCEKPMARHVSECRQIIHACEEADVLLMVAFMKRFDPAFLLVKQFIDSGELGEVYEIGVDWRWPQYFLAGWRDTIKTWGGLLQDHGSHTVDLSRWWAGEIDSVSASVKVALNGREVEDYGHVVCQHQSGCVSIHHHSRLTHCRQRENYRIEGSKGTLTLECYGQWSATLLYPFTVKLHRCTNGIQSSCTDISPRPQGSFDEQIYTQYRYSGQLHYFVECIREQKQPDFCRGEDGLAAIEVVNAAYLSAYEKQVQCLPLTGEYDLETVFRALGSGPRFSDRMGG